MTVKRPLRYPLIIVGVCVVAAVAVGLFHGGSRAKKSPAAVESGHLFFKARRGNLTISVSETGTIQPRDQVVIKSTVEGTTTILSLVSEGTLVKKGDLLVELDASQLQEDLFDWEIKVKNAEAAYIRAREDLEITKSQAQSDVEVAELNLEFARQDLKKYTAGEYPQSLNETESQITLAREDLERATEKEKWSKVLFDEKYISQTELQADELALKKANLELELAQGNLALLTNYTHSRTMASLESGVTQSTMALDRARRKSKANVIQAEAELSARESEFKRQKEKLQNVKEQIAATRICAPADGQVVYATSVRTHHWHGSEEPLEEGQQVHERQELIYLPATDRMMAVIKIHESNLEKISEGMSARVTVDALPGRELRGRVARIAPLPNAGSFWANPDLKEYDTEVHIVDDCPDLRSGMNCTVEVVVEQYTNAVYVPVQCVLLVDGKPTVFVPGNGKLEERPVTIGLDNNRMVRIAKGLEPGEEVSMTPPLERAELSQEAAARHPPAEGPAPPPAGEERTAPRKPTSGKPGARPGGPGGAGRGKKGNMEEQHRERPQKDAA